jgi:hypothetical protein
MTVLAVGKRLVEEGELSLGLAAHLDRSVCGLSQTHVTPRADR